MPRHVGIGPVDHRLVKAGPGDPGLEVVADRLTGDAAEISKDADMRGDPIRQLLAPHRLGVGEVRGPEDGDKDLRRDDFAGKTIDHLAGSAGEIDKQFLAGEVGSGASSVSAACPNAVQVAEPGIAKAVGRDGAVLLPQQRREETP